MIERHLTLIRGGKYPGYRIGNTLIRLFPASRRQQVQAGIMVFEEDTNLIMTIDEIIDFQEDHPIRLLTNVMKSRKYGPGSLIVNGRSWYAVVIDIDQEPSCQAGWIVRAYQQVHDRIEQEGMEVAALYLLGTIHGGMSIAEAMPLCIDFVVQSPFSRLKELIVIVPDQHLCQAKQYLSYLTR